MCCGSCLLEVLEAVWMWSVEGIRSSVYVVDLRY